jgi:ketosteroid isomerase-like protein
MKSFLLVFAIALTCAFSTAALVEDVNADAEAVKKVIENAYVKGIHIDRDVAAVRGGFDPAFVMFRLEKGAVTQTTIDEWVAGIEKSKKERPGPLPQKTIHAFSMVDVTGDAAVARVELYKDGKHVFTDYISLYRLADGWKIVGKIYYRHP